jgi:hypothetical protein
MDDKRFDTAHIEERLKTARSISDLTGKDGLDAGNLADFIEEESRGEISNETTLKVFRLLAKSQALTELKDSMV